MENNRGLKLLNLSRMEMLSLPRYESTKSTTKEESKMAICRQNMLFNKENIYEKSDKNHMECDSTSTSANTLDKISTSLPKSQASVNYTFENKNLESSYFKNKRSNAECLTDSSILLDKETPNFDAIKDMQPGKFELLAKHTTPVKALSEERNECYTTNSREEHNLFDVKDAQFLPLPKYLTSFGAGKHIETLNDDNKGMDKDNTSSNECLSTESDSHVTQVKKVAKKRIKNKNSSRTWKVGVQSNTTSAEAPTLLLDLPVAQFTAPAARADIGNQNRQNEAMSSSFSEDKTSGSEYLPTDSDSKEFQEMKVVKRRKKKNSHKTSQVTLQSTTTSFKAPTLSATSATRADSKNQNSSFSEDKTGSEYLSTDSDSKEFQEMKVVKRRKKKNSHKTSQVTLQSTTTSFKAPTLSATSATRADSKNQNSSFSEDKTGSEYLSTDSDSQSYLPDCISNKKMTPHVTADFEPKINSQIPKLNIVQSEIAQADSTIAEKPTKIGKGHSNCTITAARRDDEGKRLRNKRHACFFCSKEIINMARHLEITHENETEVAKILAMEKKSKIRKERFAELARIGNFNHNCKVLSSAEGELILVRRPTVNEVNLVTYSDYGPCPHCLGFMLKKHIWHHVKTGCSKKRNEDANNGEEEKKYRHVIAESNAILSNIFNSELSADYQKCILNTLRNDDVGNYCKNDQLLVKFGGMQFEKYGSTQNDLIKQRMRQLSRLTLKVRESTVRNIGLVDILAPDKFDMLIQAVKTLCGSSANNSTKRPEFAVPSLALKIGHSLKKCANIQRGIALRNNDMQRNEKLNNFISLMEMEWPIRISSNALTTLAHRKLNVPQLLPITDDLKKLKNHIDLEMNKTMKDVIATCDINQWHRLSTLTLTRMILFNKKRAGEASRMTIDQYCSRPSWSEQSTHELKDSLTAYEKKLAERLCVVHIVGKRGRKVPVILTSSIKSAIDILLKYRKDCGILEGNPYIFARANQSSMNIRGHDCLRKIVSEVDLQKPSYITGTKLRKYIATVCQIFDLNENEYDWLARHLGHDIRVHREFYRLHEDAVELTKVSRLLLAVDAGEASRFAGKKLSDIQLKDLPAIEEEDDEMEEEETENHALPGEASVKKKKQRSAVITDTRSNKRRQKSEAGVKQNKLKSAENTENKSRKKMWTVEEKAAIDQFFKIHMKNNIIPKKKDCEEIQRQHPILKPRKWSDIKFFVSNQIKKANKKK